MKEKGYEERSIIGCTVTFIHLRVCEDFHLLLNSKLKLCSSKQSEKAVYRFTSPLNYYALLRVVVYSFASIVQVHWLLGLRVELAHRPLGLELVAGTLGQRLGLGALKLGLISSPTLQAQIHDRNLLKVTVKQNLNHCNCPNFCKKSILFKYTT